MIAPVRGWQVRCDACGDVVENGDGYRLTFRTKKEAARAVRLGEHADDPLDAVVVRGKVYCQSCWTSRG